MKNVLRSVMLLAVFALLVPTVQGSLVGHWMFDEATSGAGTGVAADSSGNAYDGTLNGGAVYTTGQVGSGALQFNGTDSFVAVPYQEPMALVDSDYTISVWSKWEGPNASAAHTYQMTVSLETGYTWDGWYVAYNETNYVKYGHNSGSQLDSSPWVVPDTDYDPLAEGNLNEWKCLTVVYDQDNANRDFYVDGALVASSPTSSPLTWHDAWYLNFGVYDVGYTQADYRGFYSGALDDIQIYNHALSASEVGTVAGGGVVPEPSTFVMLIAGMLGLLVCKRRRK